MEKRCLECFETWDEDTPGYDECQGHGEVWKACYRPELADFEMRGCVACEGEGEVEAPVDNDGHS